MDTQNGIEKPKDIDTAAILAVLTEGNLARLSLPQRVEYLNQLCQTVGLNPLTQPIKFMSFQGKVVPYAGDEAARQLRKKYKLSIKITDRRKEGDLFMVTAQATAPDGRTDESIAALDITGLAGERLGNAIMKTETKAKRRVTLSIVGLSVLDETEVEDMRRADATGADKLVAVIQDTEQANAAPAPVWRYDIRKLEEKARAWSESHLASIGAIYDTEKELWVSPQRVKKLENYQVSEGAGEGAAHE